MTPATASGVDGQRTYARAVVYVAEGDIRTSSEQRSDTVARLFERDARAACTSGREVESGFCAR